MGRFGSIEGLFVNFHPLTQLLQALNLGFRECAVGLGRHIQQRHTVLADTVHNAVHKHVHRPASHSFGIGPIISNGHIFLPAVFIRFLHAGPLPFTVRKNTAFDIENRHRTGRQIVFLADQNLLAPLHALVVIMGNKIFPVFLTAVGVLNPDLVRLILVHNFKQFFIEHIIIAHLIKISILGIMGSNTFRIKIPGRIEHITRRFMNRGKCFHVELSDRFEHLSQNIPFGAHIHGIVLVIIGIPHGKSLAVFGADTGKVGSGLFV